MQDKESFFINQFPNPHIGDDGAVIGDTVYSKDLFCEDIHFKREWMSLEQIAFKSMLVNISDAIVMNAKPKFALIGIKIPFNFTPSQMEELSSGFLRASRIYNFEIIGGDTVAGDKLDISVTLISKTDNPIYRKGIKNGDFIAHTGVLGSVKKDLEKLFNGKTISKNSRFITPLLRADFFYEAAPFIHAALDISDSLGKELSRLSKTNQFGFEFYDEIKKDILCSGEEYEILFAFDPKNFDILSKISNKNNTPFTVIAKAVPGSYKSQCPENHF